MIRSRGHFVRTSGPRRYGGWGLAVALAAAALSGALGSCADPDGASASDRTGMPASAASAQSTDRDPSRSEATRAVDIAPLLTEALVAQQGTCFLTASGPERSRLVYSLLPSQASYLRLTVVASPDGARPVMVDLARGLTGRRILYATLAPGAELVRLQMFRSASDRRPTVTDVPLADPAAQHLLLLGERALTLPCRST